MASACASAGYEIVTIMISHFVIVGVGLGQHFQPTMSAPVQTASTFNIQSHVTPASILRDIPVDISRMLYMLYQDVEGQIHRSDFKAQITLSASTLLGAMAVNVGLGFAPTTAAKMSGFEWAAVFFFVLFGLFIAGAIGFSVAAAYPRSVGKGKKPIDELSLYFSADLICLAPDDFVSRFISQSNEQLKESVLKQIQIKCRVLEAKLAFVRLGLRALVASILWWALAHGALLLAYGKLIRG